MAQPPHVNLIEAMDLVEMLEKSWIGSKNNIIAEESHSRISSIASAVPPHYAFSPTPAIATKGSIPGHLGDGEVAPAQSSHRSGGGLSNMLKGNNSSHIPSQASSTAISNGVSSYRIDDPDSEDMALLPMTPNLRGTPFFTQQTKKQHVTASTPLPASAAGTKATALQLEGGGDFPPVFFSPIPQGYLSARSTSQDNFLAAGSPSDITLRGGRLAAGSLNSEWDEADSTPETPREGSVSQPGTTPIPSSSLLSKKGKTSTSNLGANNNNGMKIAVKIKQVNIESQMSSDAPPSSAKAMESAFFTSPERCENPSSKTEMSSPQLTGSGAHNYLHPILSRPPVSSNSSLADKGSAKPASLLTQALPSKNSQHLPAPNGACVGSIAAAMTASRNVHLSPDLRLVAGVSMIPHIDKVEKGGEDACCVCTRGMGSIGVADGVSGWAEEGIDPAEYSRTLMRFASEALESGPYPQGPDAREVIRYAHESTVMPGSSTVCVAVMKPGAKLQVANLGDSGVRVVRDGRVVFASAAQQHMFNMPYQLSHPSIIQSPDDADSADVTVLDIKVGDIIVLATDGLYDNVFDDESELVMHPCIPSNTLSYPVSYLSSCSHLRVDDQLSLLCIDCRKASLWQ